MDATNTYDKVKRDHDLDHFLIIADGFEIGFKDISNSKTHRSILLNLDPNISTVEIIGTCIPENCYFNLK